MDSYSPLLRVEHQILCICTTNKTIREQKRVSALHCLASVLHESDLSSSIHPPIPFFPTQALYTSLFSFQHSIIATWSPGDVSLLRSDIVGHTNRPYRPLLLTKPSPHFSGPRKIHTCTDILQ